jgi:hypothetical protein
MPDIDAMFVLVPAVILGVLTAYYAMKYAAYKRYTREEAEARAERERKRQNECRMKPY